MSTKLYDGILLKSSTHDIWTVVSQIHENIENTFKELNIALTAEYIKQSYIEHALRKYQETIGISVNEGEDVQGLVFSALEKWKNEKEPFFADKLFCKVQIYEPLEDGRILGYVFSNNEGKYYDNLTKLPFVEEFGYWNNVDQPEEVTDKQWEDRRSAWNTILDRGYYLTGSGFSIEVADTKSRTFVLPDGEFLQKINENITQENNDWRSTLSIRLIFDIMMKKNKNVIDASIKSGSAAEFINIMNNIMDVVKDAHKDELPIADLHELSIDDWTSTNTKDLVFPELIMENIDLLINKVEERLK